MVHTFAIVRRAGRVITQTVSQVSRFTDHKLSTICIFYSKLKNRDKTKKNSVKCLFFLDVDECENSPCEHNGTCINNQGSYTCACVEGWQGENCKEGTACSDANVVLEL